MFNSLFKNFQEMIDLYFNSQCICNFCYIASLSYSINNIFFGSDFSCNYILYFMCFLLIILKELAILPSLLHSDVRGCLSTICNYILRCTSYLRKNISNTSSNILSSYMCNHLSSSLLYHLNLSCSITYAPREIVKEVSEGLIVRRLLGRNRCIFQFG